MGLVVDEQPERDQREDGGEDEHARERHAAAGLHGAEPAPGGVGEQQRRGRPHRGEERVLPVGAEGDLARVDDVGDRLGGEREREQRPAEAGAPAGQRQQRDDEREQDEVEQRIGEVGGDLEPVAGGVGEHRVEGDRRGERRDRGRADGGVEPHRRVHRAAQAQAQHEHDAGADRDVGAEPERVGDRRVGRQLRGLGVGELVDDLADRPHRGAGRQRQPGRAAVLRGEAAQREQRRRAEHERDVDPAGEDVEHIRPAKAEGHGDIGGEDDQQARPCHSEGALAGNALVQALPPWLWPRYPPQTAHTTQRGATWTLGRVNDRPALRWNATLRIPARRGRSRARSAPPAG